VGERNSRGQTEQMFKARKEEKSKRDPRLKGVEEGRKTKGKGPEEWNEGRWSALRPE